MSEVDMQLLRALSDASATMRTGLDQLHDTLTGSGSGAFLAAVDAIAKCRGRVVVSGMGKSGHIGRKIAATLASTGTPALFVHPAEASHGDLGMIDAADVVLALSWSGETAELSDIVAYTRRFGVPLIAITSLSDSSLASSADIVLLLPRAAEACPNGLAPTTSTLMQLTVGDLLAITLLSKRGFTASDFRRFHPGGKLGAQLKRVGDIMKPLDAVARVQASATVGDALVEMSERGLSYALVLQPDNRLAGLITDGDMRRNMAPDLMARAVSSVMTKNPRVFLRNGLAAEALSALNEFKVTAAPVIDDNGNAIGGIHVIDFMRAGVL